LIISHNARYTPSSVPIVEHARLPILGEGHAAQEKILMASTELKSILDRSSDSASHLTAMTGSQLVAVLQDCAEQTLSFDAAPSKSEVVRWGASESADLLDCGWALGAVIHRRLHTSYYEARERQALRMCDALCAEEDFLKERKKPVKVSAMSKKKKKQKKKRNENIACAKSGTVDSGPRVDFVAEEFPAEDEMGNAPILGQEVEMTRGPAPACVPNGCGPRNSLPSDDEMFMDNDEEIATKEVSGECTAVAQQSSEPQCRLQLLKLPPLLPSRTGRIANQASPINAENLMILRILTHFLSRKNTNVDATEFAEQQPKNLPLPRNRLALDQRRICRL